MSVASLDRLELCQEALIRALDANEIEAVESAVGDLYEAVNEVRAAGAWRRDESLKARAKRVLALIEAARIRVNFLTDRNRERLEQLAALRGRVHAGVYSREGVLTR